MLFAVISARVEKEASFYSSEDASEDDETYLPPQRVASFDFSDNDRPAGKRHQQFVKGGQRNLIRWACHSLG